MNKPSSLIWMVLIILIVFPTPAGKIIIDLAGGIFLIIAISPLVLGGVGWIVWKKIQSNIQTCTSCGSSLLNSQDTCPICGANIRNTKDNLANIPASAATIDIKSEDIDL